MMYKNDVMVKYEEKGEWKTGEETESISIMVFIILKLNVNKIMSNKFPKIYDAKYYFDDDLYQLEVESKGCLLNIIVEFSNNIKYKILFMIYLDFRKMSRKSCNNLLFFMKKTSFF